MTNTSSMISFESNYMLLKCRTIINLYMSICHETFLLYNMSCIKRKSQDRVSKKVQHKAVCTAAVKG